MMAILLVEIRNKIPILDSFEPGFANKTQRYRERNLNRKGWVA